MMFEINYQYKNDRFLMIVDDEIRKYLMSDSLFKKLFIVIMY